MTAFDPTTRSIHPPPHPDPLGEAIVSAFSRDLGYRLTWDWPIVLLLGLLTAGLVPLIVLTLRFRTYAKSEKFQLEHVTEWIELRGTASRELTAATTRLRELWPTLTAMGLALATLGFAVAVVHLLVTSLSLPSLISLFTIYRPAGLAPLYMLIWCGAFACHWLAVQRHAARVGNYVAAVRQKLGPIEHSPAWVNAPMVWIIIGFVLLIAGCVWGLAMMLAAGAHRRYIKHTSAAIRAQIASRVQTLMQQPAVAAA